MDFTSAEYYSLWNVIRVINSPPIKGHKRVDHQPTSLVFLLLGLFCEDKNLNSTTPFVLNLFTAHNV